MKRENIIGRANVEDTPELEAYYRELEGEDALAAVPADDHALQPVGPEERHERPVLPPGKSDREYVRRDDAEEARPLIVHTPR